MVVNVTQHLGKESSLAKKTVQFRELNKTERTWTKFKAYYHNALRVVKQEHKCLGAKSDYQANSVIAARNAKEAAEQKAREDMTNKMSGPFNAFSWRQTSVWCCNLPPPNYPFSPPVFPPIVPTAFFQPIWQQTGHVRKHGNCRHGVQKQHCGCVMSCSQKIQQQMVLCGAAGLKIARVPTSTRDRAGLRRRQHRRRELACDGARQQVVIYLLIMQPRLTMMTPLAVPTHLTLKNNRYCRQCGIGLCNERRNGLWRRDSAGTHFFVWHLLQSSNLHIKNVETKTQKSTRKGKESFRVGDAPHSLVAVHSGTCGRRMRNVLQPHRF